MIYIVTALMAVTAHAQPWRPQWLSRLCSSLIESIPEDPYPLAENSSRQLLEMYQFSTARPITKELIFRLRAGMLAGYEVRKFWELTEAHRNVHDLFVKGHPLERMRVRYLYDPSSTPLPARRPLRPVTGMAKGTMGQGPIPLGGLIVQSDRFPQP